jgi:TolB-like protein
MVFARLLSALLLLAALASAPPAAAAGRGGKPPASPSTAPAPTAPSAPPPPTAPPPTAPAAPAPVPEAVAPAPTTVMTTTPLQARGLDARMRALADALALQLKRLPGDHRDQTFAVVPFENVGEETTQRSLGVVVADLITTDLARDHRLALTERGQLNRIMGELALQQSGAVDDKQVTELGKLAGARALVVGRVADAGAEFVVTARAVDVDSGAVLVAEDVNLPKDELVAFSASAVVLRSRSGAMFRSVVLPGWGQTYNDEPVKGALFGIATGSLALATAVVGGHALYGRFVEYPAAGLSGESEQLPADEKSAYVAALRERVNAEGVAAQVLLGVTASVWLLNVADAWLSGTDVENLDAALARN